MCLKVHFAVGAPRREPRAGETDRRVKAGGCGLPEVRGRRGRGGLPLGTVVGERIRASNRNWVLATVGSVGVT